MSKLTKAKREEVIDIMLKEYDGMRCALDYGSEFQLLVAVVLSAQTTDVAVNKVTPALFAKAPDAEAMSKLKQTEIEQYIKQIGLYKNKAKNVKALSLELVERFGGIVPCTMEELVTLPGVGRKTANVVLAEVFGQQTIAVDTHVFRLANRIGLAAAENVLDTEKQLQKAIPHENWTQMHHALIWHGRRVCNARKPNCEVCCISSLCKMNGVEGK